MPATLVTTLAFYRHPKTGRRIPLAQEKAFRLWFKKRYKGRRPKREQWLYTTDGEPATYKYPGEKYMRLVPGGPLYRIQLAYKMTQVEKILPLTGFTDRHIRATFNEHDVFADIWNNWGGIIRMTVSGTLEDGRRVKKIIYRGYHKEHWELTEGRGRGGKIVSGREMFRRWLISSVSTSLRRRGLRLSNLEESQDRIARLQKKLAGDQAMTEFVKPDQMGAHVNKLIWGAKAIRDQKRSRRIQGATIRIEKLA